MEPAAADIPGRLPNAAGTPYTEPLDSAADSG